MGSRGKDNQDKATREDRLRAALRANLQRRKAQARARAEQDALPDDPTSSETGEDDS